MSFIFRLPVTLCYAAIIHCVAVVAVAAPRVAVCVCGLLHRLQPESLAAMLFAPNAALFKFDAFFVLEPGPGRFSSGVYGARPTPFATIAKVEQARLRLKNLMTSLSPLATLGKVEFFERVTAQSFAAQSNSSVESVNVFQQAEYADLVDSLLSMLLKQVRCAVHVAHSEVTHSVRYDYIVMAREDTFLLQPMDMSLVVDKLHSSNCDFVSRDCIVWGGVCTRLQIGKRDFALRLYMSRKAFLMAVIRGESHPKPYNTEIFELLNIQWLNGSRCTLSPDFFGVTVSRYINETAICFPDYEVSQNPRDLSCVPVSMKNQIRENICKHI